VQKESVIEQQKELELIAAEPFARAIDDPRMEEMRKQVPLSHSPSLPPPAYMLSSHSFSSPPSFLLSISTGVT
jgi:hypothetical protein